MPEVLGTRSHVLVVAIVVASVTGACTPGTSSTAPPPQPTATVVPSASPEPTTDVVTPLIVKALSDPIPVKGSDGRYHVAYELQILNYSPRVATLRSVETIDTRTQKVVTTMDHDAIVASSILVGHVPAEPKPVTQIPAGGTIILLMDDTYPTRGDVAPQVVHRISADFAPPAPDQSSIASDIYPAKATETTGVTNVGAGEPLVIGAPIQGNAWVAVNACCTLTPHRGAMTPMNGRINATERYGIDWIQIDPNRFQETFKKGLLPSFRSDPTRNEDYLAFDQPLFAVADGTVVKVVDGRKDLPPQRIPKGLVLDEFGGNYIVLDLGGGYYAFYAHAKQGSITVREGSHVKRGDVIAHLGNSGSTSEAHLHFQIMRGPAPLGSTNWPFVIDRFSVTGSLSETGMVNEPPPGERQGGMVMVLNVTDFPKIKG